MTRFVLTTPEVDRRPGPLFHCDLSDGTRLAYSRDGHLYLREMDQLDAVRIGGIDDHVSWPFFSPDGHWIGFSASDKLKKVSVSGGVAVTICDARSSSPASWATDGAIYFAERLTGILRVSASGGEPEVVVSLDASGGEAVRGIQLLPDGNSLLFTLATGSWSSAQIVVQSLDTGARKVLIQGGHDAQFVPTGHLIYASEGTLWARPFDLQALEVRGNPVPVVEDVSDRDDPTLFSFSNSGTLAYQPESVFEGSGRLVWLDRQGRELSSVGEPGIYQNPELSPDESRLVVRRQDSDSGNLDLWIFDLQRNVPSRFTFDPGNDLTGVWSADGDRIGIRSNRDGIFQLYEKPATGTGEAELLLDSDVNIGPIDWSQDERYLLYTRGEDRDIHVLPMYDDHRPFVFLDTEFPQVSSQALFRRAVGGLCVG